MEQELFSLDLLQEDSLFEYSFSVLEHFDFSYDLLQDFFSSPLQHVPFTLFSHLESQTFPVLIQVFSVFTFSLVFYADILLIPINRKDNNKIDIFFIFFCFLNLLQI